MLHDVELPRITRTKLAEVMWWQFDLLCWAVKARRVDKEACRDWLAQMPRLRTRAAKIADWVFNTEARREAIKAFATDRTVTSQQKTAWVNKRRGEAKRLLLGPQGSLTAVDYSPKTAPAWRLAARSFWLSFYSSLRGAGFPAALFGADDSQGFTDQMFLHAFLEVNQSLCVCPVCDTTAYFTIVQREKGPEVYTDIDHYLPKGSYPHLAIHPFNLVPLCHNCNSGTKGEIDPLAEKNGFRYNLQDVWLPYRHKGLSRSLYISVAEQGKELSFNAFALKSNALLPLQLPAVVDVLERVYQIPERWKERMEEIGDKLFRRMRDYSRFYDIAPDGYNALDHLDELLFFFDQDDTAREPYAIAMAWLLVYLLNAEEADGAKPLADEVGNWQQEQQKFSATMRNHGRRMREV